MQVKEVTGEVMYHVLPYLYPASREDWEKFAVNPEHDVPAEWVRYIMAQHVFHGRVTFRGYGNIFRPNVFMTQRNGFPGWLEFRDYGLFPPAFTAQTDDDLAQALETHSAKYPDGMTEEEKALYMRGEDYLEGHLSLEGKCLAQWDKEAGLWVSTVPEEGVGNA